MHRTIDHDRFVAKNKSLALAEEVKRKDDDAAKSTPRPERRSCFNCKMKTGCSEFRARRSGRSTGVVSFGGDDSFVCDKFVAAPQQNRGMSAPQIKALLKNIKKGY